MKLKIENATKCWQKAVKISFMCGCKCVSVYGCECMCVRVDVCFLVKSGQERKALVIAVLGYECVYICFNIFFRWQWDKLSSLQVVGNEWESDL